MTERVTAFQDVYDLIIATCQHDPKFKAWGASALRFLNRIDPALAAATGTAKTPQAVECEASQSGPKGNAQTPSESYP
jgi:hypothetical protein